MNVSSKTFSTPSSATVLPDLDASRATIEEMDEWILSQGGRRLSTTDAQDVVKQVAWARIDGENPEDEQFPLSPLVSD